MGKGKPAVVIFSKDVGGDLAGLAKEIDKVAVANKGSISYLVYLNGEKDKAKQTLASFAKTNKLTAVDTTVNASGIKAPKGYKINPEVKHTVLVYSGNKVVANFAFDKVDEKLTKKIVAASEKAFKAGPSKKEGRDRKSRRDRRGRRDRDS